jgi:hypothetical protein
VHFWTTSVQVHLQNGENSIVKMRKKIYLITFDVLTSSSVHLKKKLYIERNLCFRVENCRTAMVLAKEHLSIPRVISPEDFASEALDELSAMTYLSYFVRSESPGYYDTLNWVCKQLRTTQITNLTVQLYFLVIKVCLFFYPLEGIELTCLYTNLYNSLPCYNSILIEVRH